MADEQTVRGDNLCTIFSVFKRTAVRSYARWRSRSRDVRTVANTKREFQPKVGQRGAFWPAISHCQYDIKREGGHSSAFWSANPHSFKTTIGAVRYTHSAEAIGTISRRIGSPTLYPVEG